LEKVENVAIAAMQALPSRLKSEEVTLHWKEFGDSSINFSVNIWLTYTKEELKFVSVKNEAIKALKKAFDEHDIMIPFPIRTLDFGIKGGEKLVEVIENTGLSKFDKNGTDNKENFSPAEGK
jgi:small conductance mechanosensitive channel